MPDTILRPILLGIAVGPSCLGFCLPFTLPVFTGTGRTGLRATGFHFITFLAGRLIAYAISGAIFGILGTSLTRATIFHSTILPFVYFLLALLMLVYGITGIASFQKFAPCRLLHPFTESRWLFFALGFLTGISPCPAFLLALFSVMEVGGIINGIIFFLIFFLFTTIFLLPLVLSALVNRYPTIRIAARIVAIFTTLYFSFIARKLLS